MKKEKLFKIGVVNKSTVNVTKDTTTFYTSDTELWLGFELAEVEYSYDNAEILLLNEDDRSFVVRPITQGQDGYWYEIEADITAHYGLWKGQLQLSKDDEVYTSKPFNFRIENDLSNDRPPQLVDVNNWTRLKQSANELIVDMRQAITEADKSESSRVEAEQERATAESDRKSAELLRIENENQRKTDHANRSAELAGKADKVVLENLVDNGDFSQGTTGWIASSAIEIDNNTIHVKSDNPEPHSIWKDIASVGSNDKFYVTLDFNLISNPENRAVFTSIRDYGTLTSVSLQQVNLQIMNQYQSLSTIVSSPNGIRLTPIYVTNPRYEARLTNVMAFNLTTVFGAGNEPTKEEMDELVKVTGYVDGEYALNNKEMLIWTLALIRRNKNAITTLGGTI